MSQSKEFLNDVLNGQYDKRAYAIDDVGGGLYELDEDMTRYDQVGTGLTAEDIVDVGVLACDHVKTGTAHNLLNPNPGAKVVRFIATATYAAGDTFAFNGNALAIRGTPAFGAGDTVIALLDSGSIGVVSGGAPPPEITTGGATGSGWMCKKYSDGTIECCGALTNIAATGAMELTLPQAMKITSFIVSAKYVSGVSSSVQRSFIAEYTPGTTISKMFIYIRDIVTGLAPTGTSACSWYAVGTWA